jgi:hypothetical protein
VKHAQPPIIEPESELEMTKHDQDPRDASAPRTSRQARLRGLLFAGVALGTTLLTLGGSLDPKLPPFRGE